MASKQTTQVMTDDQRTAERERGSSLIREGLADERAAVIKVGHGIAVLAPTYNADEVKDFRDKVTSLIGKSWDSCKGYLAAYRLTESLNKPEAAKVSGWTIDALTALDSVGETKDKDGKVVRTAKQNRTDVVKALGKTTRPSRDAVRDARDKVVGVKPDGRNRKSDTERAVDLADEIRDDWATAIKGNPTPIVAMVWGAQKAVDLGAAKAKFLPAALLHLQANPTAPESDESDK